MNNIGLLAFENSIQEVLKTLEITGKEVLS
jgi:hypothetical protein